MISVIIPVLDESGIIAATLEAVLSQPGQYEVIVVDGNSTDATREIVQSFHDVTLLTASRGRSRQMNTGAARARGAMLCFLHADTRLPDNALLTLEALSRTDCRAGCFRQRFSGTQPLLGFISRLHNWRCSRTRIIYGDQTLFVRRDLFHRLGGFPDVDILEDVMFSERLLQETTPVLLDDEVITDSRKFVQRGILRSFIEVAIILACYELRLPVLARGFFSPVR